MNASWSRFILLCGRPWFGPPLLAVTATIAVSLALDPAGDYPHRFEGPGLTVDEIFNVDLGARLADRVLNGDFLGAVRVGQTLPDHPPLGRLWLGMFHELAVLIDPPRGEHSGLVVAAARYGSAVALGMLIWLIGWSAAQWYGNAAGWGAAAGLILMPRVFGHAHLAALETMLNLTYAGAVLCVAQTWCKSSPPSTRAALLCGIWLGLASLTKIQAIFIPIPVAVWAIMNWRHKALLPLLVWGLTGLVVFFCGWPWLWLDPVGNCLKYLGHASDRASIRVWYWGQAFADKSVPWHYPWVLFATTVPLGVHLLGLCGVCWRSSSGRDADAGSIRHVANATTNIGEVYSNQPDHPSVAVEWLLLGTVLFPLFVFSIPGVAVYDGERLFLMVFPVWAIFVGRGVAIVGLWLGRRMPPLAASSLLTLFLAVQVVGLWQLAPCWLSYFNCIGGLTVARDRGFQMTYWGDSVTRELLQHTAEAVPDDTTIEVAPVLHPFQLAALESQCPALRQRGIKLKPLDISVNNSPSEYIIIYQRAEYLPAGWLKGPPGYRPMKELVRQGVVLAGLYRAANNSTLAE